MCPYQKCINSTSSLSLDQTTKVTASHFIVVTTNLLPNDSTKIAEVKRHNQAG